MEKRIEDKPLFKHSCMGIGQVWIGVYDWRRRGKKPWAANGKRPPRQKRSAKFLRLKQYQLPLSAWRLYISSAGAGASVLFWQTGKLCGGGGGSGVLSSVGTEGRKKTRELVRTEFNTRCFGFILWNFTVAVRGCLYDLGVGYTVKKRSAIFPSPAGMVLTQLSLTGNNSQAGRVWLVTSRLETGKSRTFFTV
jgi:hypothetical protein